MKRNLWFLLSEFYQKEEMIDYKKVFFKINLHQRFDENEIEN